jgi:hypothetical protein
MRPPDLPPDLAALERLLEARPSPPHDPDLRRRVLEAVAGELADEGRAGPGSFWRFAAGVAAAVLLACNLAVSVAHDTDWRLDAPPPPEDDTAGRIAGLLPELSEPEAQRQALLLRARGW